MIPEQQARASILDRVVSGGREELSPGEALGRFFGRDYLAAFPSPPFDNSAMDGYALRAEDGATMGAELVVAGEQPAGRRDEGLSLGAGEAIRIFTGAPIPAGATAVIMQEDVELVGDRGIRVMAPVVAGEHIRRAGADLCAGQVIASRGERITPQMIGLLASQGIAAIEAGRSPAASVITTGDEVVQLGEPELSPGQIYNSNGPMLEALLQRSGVVKRHRSHARDEESALEATIDEALARSDLVILAGGVSVGERDLVKAVLESRGVATDFWRVRVKPGKPFLFGHRENVLVFGLPGNPVSGFVTYVLFVEPAIRKWMGARRCEPVGIPCEMASAVANPGDRPHYLRGELDMGRMRFLPLGMQQSHALHGLSRANALVRVDEGASWKEGAPAVAFQLT